MDAAREIENLIYSYAANLDSGNLEEVANLLRHAELSNSAVNTILVGYDAILDTYKSMTRIYSDTGTPKTRHLTTNVIINVDDDCATAHSYFTVIQATDQLPMQAIIAGHYQDSFVFAEARWRFSARHIVIELTGDLSAHLLAPVPDIR